MNQFHSDNVCAFRNARVYNISTCILITKKVQRANSTDRCVTATTSGIPGQYYSKPRDTGAPASFRAAELATSIVRLFAQCRAICTHAFRASEECPWKYFVNTHIYSFRCCLYRNFENSIHRNSSNFDLF